MPYTKCSHRNLHSPKNNRAPRSGKPLLSKMIDISSCIQTSSGLCTKKHKKINKTDLVQVAKLSRKEKARKRRSMREEASLVLASRAKQVKTSPSPFCGMASKMATNQESPQHRRRFITNRTRLVSSSCDERPKGDQEACSSQYYGHCAPTNG